jgi:hypothetical protein
MDSSNIEEPGIVHAGISRRTMIKAGAIVGATLWVAPVVESFTTPASAASFSAGCVMCYYYDGSNYVLFASAQDDPTPNNGEPSQLCVNNRTGTGAEGINSGYYVLFNSNVISKSVYFGAANNQCSYNGSLLYGQEGDLSFPTPPTCPSAATPNVYCSTGRWTA